MRIAYPEDLAEVLPLNASALFVEWLHFVDPVRTLVDGVIAVGLNDTWLIGEKSIVPPYAGIELLRQVAKDERLVEVVQGSEGHLSLVGTDAVTPISKILITDEDAHEERVGALGDALLRGLAVAIAVTPDQGLKGGDVFTAFQRRKPSESDSSA